MTAPVQRTIDELIARYELESKLCDIFVEGSFDREILSNVAQKNKIDAFIYEIDTVDVPPDLLMKYGLTNGNKQRVITLAKELANHDTGTSYRCIVDRDLDTWNGKIESVKALIYTKFTSIELYFFSEELLKDIVVVTGKSKISDFELYLLSLIKILQCLFGLRLADKELDWKLSWLPLYKFIKKEGSELKFDFDDYLAKLLLKNSRSKFGREYKDKIAGWNSKLIGDYRLSIRGHDFVELISLSIKEFKGISDFTTESAIERLLILLAPQNKLLFELIQ